MSEPFLAEIKIISWNFAPRGWAFCNGQLLPINQNQALFSLLGTTYGGDGRVNFALPDLRGRAPLHRGTITLGSRGGEEFHTLSIGEIPSHTHQSQASNTTGDTPIPTGNVLGNSAAKMYHAPTNLTTLLPASITPYGQSQGHENRQPYLVLNFVIALQGLFPSRN